MYIISKFIRKKIRNHLKNLIKIDKIMLQLTKKNSSSKTLLVTLFSQYIFFIQHDEFYKLQTKINYLI